MARPFKCAVCQAPLTQSANDDGRCPRCSAPIRREAPPEFFITRADDDVVRRDVDMASPERLSELQTRFDGRYRFVKLLGQGGMGAVYKVIDLRLDREVALKILPAGYAKSPERTKRFEQEAKALAKLRHQGIVTVFDYGQEESIHWLSMEYVDGKTLREELERSGKLEVERVVRMVDQICDALAAAHDAGLVHRDIKPENILLTPQDQPRIVDFGLAKLLGSARPGHNMSSEGRVLGTANYMSPEQQEGRSDVDVRSDVYSLGKVIYEMLSGRRPEGKFPSLASVGAAQACFDELIAKALDPVPERRHASIRELRAALPRRHAGSAWLGTNSASAKPKETSGWSDRKKWAMGSLGSLTVAVLIWHYQREIGSMLSQRDEPETKVSAALDKLDKGTNVERQTAVDELRSAGETAPPVLAARIVSGLSTNLVQHSPSGHRPSTDARGCAVCPPAGSPAIVKVDRWWSDSIIALGELRFGNPSVRSASWKLDGFGLAGGDVQPTANSDWLFFVDGSMLNADLRGSKWRRADMDGALLMQAQMSGASFQSCRFVKAALRSVCALDARFRLSNLSSADFERACLERAHFTSCVLQHAKFSGANLKGVSFLKVDIRGADFSEAEGLRAEQFVEVTWDLDTRLPPAFARSALPASVEFDASNLAQDVLAASKSSAR